jgi:hypothetical protein
MNDAYVETTILADILLKPNTPKQARAKIALKRYSKTLLPVYSIKEWKAGPLSNFAYLHDKLVVTGSFRDTLHAVSVLPRGGYRQSTSLEALTAAATPFASESKAQVRLGTSDRDLADVYRLALASLIIRGWRKRRKVTTQVVDDLPCYTEAEPYVGKDGLFELEPKQCERDQECSLASRLKARPELLSALRDAIPEKSSRNEDQRRRRALKRLIKHPNDRLDREACRDLGDAVFAFFCPDDAVILTTNLRDHEPLARAIGKRAEKP